MDAILTALAPLSAHIATLDLTQANAARASLDALPAALTEAATAALLAAHEAGTLTPRQRRRRCQHGLHRPGGLFRGAEPRGLRQSKPHPLGSEVRLSQLHQRRCHRLGMVRRNIKRCLPAHFRKG
jgi:hypothetical protein